MSNILSKSMQANIPLLVRFNNDIKNDGNNSLNAIISNYQIARFPTLSSYLVEDSKYNIKSAIKCRPNRDWDIKLDKSTNLNLLSTDTYMSEWTIDFMLTINDTLATAVDSLVISGDNNPELNNMKICFRNRMMWVEVNSENSQYLDMKNNPIDLGLSVGSTCVISISYADYVGLQIYKDNNLLYTIHPDMILNNWGIIDAEYIAFAFLGAGIHTFDELKYFNRKLNEGLSLSNWYIGTSYLLDNDYTFEPIAFNSSRIGNFRYFEGRFFEFILSATQKGSISVRLSTEDLDPEYVFNNNIGKYTGEKIVNGTYPSSINDIMDSDDILKFTNSIDEDTFGIGPLNDPLYFYSRAIDSNTGNIIYDKTYIVVADEYDKLLVRKAPDVKVLNGIYDADVWRREHITEAQANLKFGAFYDYELFNLSKTSCLIQPKLDYWYDDAPAYICDENGLTFHSDVTNAMPWRITLKAKSKRMRLIGRLNTIDNDGEAVIDEYMEFLLSLNNSDISTVYHLDNIASAVEFVYTTGGEQQHTCMISNNGDDIILDIEIKDYDPGNHSTVSIGFLIYRACNFNLQAVDYYLGEQDITKYPEASLPTEKAIIKERLEFDPELFEKITYGEFINNQLDVAGYSIYQTPIKIVNITDKRILDAFGKFEENTMLTFKKNGNHLDREESIFFISVVEDGHNKQYSMDAYDPNYEVFMYNDYIYLYSRRFEKPDFILSELTIGVIKANKENIIEKKIHQLPDYTDYKDDYFRIVFTNDGMNMPITTTLPGTAVTIKVKHTIIPIDSKSIVHYDKILATPGICYHGMNVLFGVSSIKLNKFVINNPTYNIMYVAIPYLDDIYDRSYYENFIKAHLNVMVADMIPAISPLHKKIQNMKLYLDHTSDYFKEYLSEIYKYDSGVYEKLLLEKTIKKFYYISNKVSDIVDSGIEFTNKAVNNYYTFQESLFHISVYDIENIDEFEIYVNGKFLHRKPTAVIHYAGMKHIYLSKQSITSSWRSYVVENGIALDSDVKFLTDEVCFNRYYNDIINTMTIFIKRRRSDYRAHHTGINDIEMNVVELPLGSGYLYGMSIFVDGLRLSAEDFYYERVAGIQCAILKRKYEKGTPVTITYYLNNINMVIKEISPTNRISTKVSAEGDDVFVDGYVITPETSYTPDVSNMVIKLISDNTDYTITHITYSDVKGYIATDTDYRSKLLAHSTAVWDSILNFTSKRVSGKTRKIDQADIEAYVYYLKYLVGGDHEPSDIYAMIDGNIDLTQTERDRLKEKYTTLFSEGDMFFYGGIEKDYPEDIIIGDIETNMDLRARSYKDTLNAILYLFKGNYIKETDEDVVFDMNYIGQDIII